MWSNLKQEDKVKEEVTKQEEEYREYLRTTSEAMTSRWENSIENTRKRKGKEREEAKVTAIVQGISKSFSSKVFVFKENFS